MPAEDGRCDECGFDYDAEDDPVAALEALPRRYAPALTRFLPGEDGDAVVRTRPDAGTWSALEYAGHVRDAVALYRERIERALVEDRPAYVPMDPDQVAIDRAYNEAIVADVLDGLQREVASLTTVLSALDPRGWERLGVRNGDDRTVRWMVRHTVHEGHHHQLDVGRALRAARERNR